MYVPNTTWVWKAREPMASYLAMMAVGEFDVRAYRERGIEYWDAVDPRLYEPVAPRTGERFAYSQSANLAYKRLARTIDVPASGGELSFWVTRDIEANWDYFLVEAHPEIIAWQSSLFGRYPFSAAGGIVDIAPIGFALETQTRPIYSTAFFTAAQSGEDVVVHEIAHQWFGDYLTIARRRDIWLNEGFATYAEWLWSEHDGRETAQEIFDFYYNGIPAGHPFWTVIIGHPQSENLLDIAVYWRGAMAVHALRNAVGDEKFFRLLRVWVREQRGGHVTVEEFIATAERVTRMQLDDLFQTWLFTPAKPEAIGTAAAAAALRAAPAWELPARVRKR